MKKYVMTKGLSMDGSLRAVVAAVLMSTNIFSTNTFAHNIDVNQAKQKVDVYAKRVQKQRDFIRFDLFCQALNRGHNHQVGCKVGYHNSKSWAAGRYACVEEITVYFQAHRGDKRNWQYYMTHVGGRFNARANPCGDEMLSGPMP